MSPPFTQRQLNAGGLVATKTKCDAKLTEAIVARTYGSSALGDRVVVRLSSDRLVPAEDLAMEYLGLEGKEITPPLARQNRTALDFAHWALINQPKQARYALDLVKQMKAAARRAASKPGHAWDMYAEMADELNKSVRHFLPPFWEQAARSFKDLGNATYAGRALNKALEAERVHALEVDREHRRDAVLEFSLSGCLSGKALTEYSKDLADQFEPVEAYETYKDLVIRRTMGGMPPVANAASDLIRMASMAKLDVDQEVESVLEAIISSPAMSRASMQFWKSVKKYVARIVARNEEFGVWLLAHTDPQPQYNDDSLVWQWLDQLEEWNVLPLLSKPADQLPDDVEIPGGRAGWFSRLAGVEASPNKRVFELLEQMADVLRAEGQPIDLARAKSWRSIVDVDVLEACLQLGLEVADPRGNLTLSFDGWLREMIDHPRRNSQLEYVTKDPRFASRLRDEIPELITFRGEDRVERSSWGRNVAVRRSFEEAAADHPVVREAWWQYLDSQLRSLETGGLVDFEVGLEHLRACAGVKTAAEFPQFLPRLKTIDPGLCLQRTLSAGVFDEYGWEALDKVDDEHPVPRASRRDSLLLHWTFPRFAFLHDNQVHVVDPESHSPPREVTLTRQQEVRVLLPVGDDLLLAYRDNGRSWKVFIRWLSEPKNEYEQRESYFSWNADAIVRVNESAWFYGARAIQPGDTVLPKVDKDWYCDGSRFWRVKHDSRYNRFDELEDEARPSVSEIDPESGKNLRDSVPPFFETDLPAGSQVIWHLSCLLPLPKQAGSSPLGSRQGIIGWRVVRRRDGAMESVGIDGRRVMFEADVQPTSGFVAAIGLMDKPASDSSWIVMVDGRIMDSETRIAFARVADNRTKYSAGQPAQLPTLFYHLMRVRSPETSKELRATTTKQANVLLEAGLVEHEARKEKEDPKNPDPKRNAAKSAVAKWLPKAPPRLVTGVARIARVAAEEQKSLNNLLKRFEPKEDEATGGSTAGDVTVDTERARAGLAQLDLPLLPNFPIHGFGRETQDNAAHLMAVGRFFAGHACREMPACDLFWFELLRDPAATGWRCFWKTATNVELGESVGSRIQTPWLDALRCLAESKLLDLPGSYKIYQANAPQYDKPKKGSFEEELETDHPIVLQEGKNRYVAYRFRGYPNDHIFVLAYAENGRHKPPKKLIVENTLDVNPGWKSGDLLSFVAAVKKIEALPLPTSEELDAAGHELNVHPIAVALTFMGDLRTVRYGQEKLTKELRAHYGWKVKDIQPAISQLEGLDLPKSVGCDFARANPSDALGAKREVAFKRMIKAWKENRKDVVPIPAELAKDLERAGSRYRSLSIKQFAELLSDPKQSDVLARHKAVFAKPNKSGYYQQLEVQYSPELSVDPESVCRHLIKAVALVNYRLPVGDPLRTRIPVLIEEIRRFLVDPETQLPFGKMLTQAGDLQDIDVEATVATFATHIGPLEQGEDGLYRGDDGFVSLALVPPHVSMLFRPAKLTDSTALQRLQAIAGMTMGWDGPGTHEIPCADFVLRMRGEDMTELAEDNRQSAFPEGSWEQDPRVSAPAMVKQATRQLGVSEDAATLYLQTLALPDPTALNIRTWNSWSPKQYQEAAAELVAAGHLVSAKRTRAGREIFLPGGWEDLKLPNLPIESWKLPIFGYDSAEPLRGGGAELIVCERSIGRQFENAWQRVQNGDPPQYEEVTTKRKRK